MATDEEVPWIEWDELLDHWAAANIDWQAPTKDMIKQAHEVAKGIRQDIDGYLPDEYYDWCCDYPEYIRVLPTRVPALTRPGQYKVPAWSSRPTAWSRP